MNVAGRFADSSSRPPSESINARASASPSPVDPPPENPRSKMCSASSSGTPGPMSVTSMTTVSPLVPTPSLAVSVTVPLPWRSALSSSTPITSRSRAGDTFANRLSCSFTLRDLPTARIGARHSSVMPTSSPLRSTGSAPVARASRAAVISSSSTSARRSACSSAACASPAISLSGTAVSSSIRSCSDVNRLRSWWDTSPTSSRSRCTSCASAVADASSASATESSSPTRYRVLSSRKSPAPRRAARSATCRSGRASRRAVTVATAAPPPIAAITTSTTSSVTCVCVVRMGPASIDSTTLPCWTIGTSSDTVSPVSSSPNSRRKSESGSSTSRCPWGGTRSCTPFRSSSLPPVTWSSRTAAIWRARPPSSSRVRLSTTADADHPSGMPSATAVTVTASRIARRMRRRMCA